MNSIRYAVDSIFRKPIRFIFTVIQISVGTMILFNALSLTLKAVDTVNKSTKDYIGKSLYSICDITNSDRMDDIKNSKDIDDTIYKMYNFLKDNNDFIVCSKFRSDMFLKDFCDDDKFCRYEDRKHTMDPYPGIYGDFSNVNGYYIDYNYFKEFRLDVQNGRSFEKDDFVSKDEVPVILGNDYNSKYNIGDEFDCFDFINLKKKKVKVIGFLNKDMYAFDGSIFKLDNFVIYPLDNMEENSTNKLQKFNMLMTNPLIITDDSSKTICSILDESSKLNLYDYQIESVEKNIDIEISYLKENATTSMIISILILLFICFGMITVQLNEIKTKTYEYGVFIICGSTKKEIILEIIFLLQ